MSRVLPVFENGFTEAGHLILKIYLLDETKVDLGDATLLQRRENGPPNKIGSIPRLSVDCHHHGCRKAHGNCNKRLISNNARPDMDALKTTRVSCSNSTLSRSISSSVRTDPSASLYSVII